VGHFPCTFVLIFELSDNSSAPAEPNEAKHNADDRFYVETVHVHKTLAAAIHAHLQNLIISLKDIFQCDKKIVIY